MTVVPLLRVLLTTSLLALLAAGQEWGSDSFLQNTLDDRPPEGTVDEDEESFTTAAPLPVAEAWVPGDFAAEVAGLRIPSSRSRLPLRQRQDSEEEEDEDSDEEEQDSEEDDYHEYKKSKVPKKKPRPYVVNYEVTETIPYDTKKPRPKGPVYPLPPPCPGAPPPTFPPPETTKAPKDYFPTFNYESYFPTSYMSQSIPAKNTYLNPWTSFGTGSVPQGNHPQPAYVNSQQQIRQFPTLAQQPFPGSPLGPIHSPQTSHPRILPPPPPRYPRRTSPQRRLVVRVQRPTVVIRKIQQVGPGADTLIIRHPARAPVPRLKEVHIHHHHDPGPVIHVHKDDDDFLADAKFQAVESDSDFEAAGHFAEPALKSEKHIHTS